MSTVADPVETGIRVTVNAANKVASLIAEEENPGLKLRVYITGGGCSGFQYGFSFEETINPDDFVTEHACSNGLPSIQLLIDSMSYQYLSRAEIDYVEDIGSERFVIRNPDTKTTCGCGSSFSMEEE